ncbi:MAG: hypothetical protein JO130_16050, partial [Solirubrobacterales bacterium]|nr:hypothetical protein [Solirubrobacterales bacterium]
AATAVALEALQSGLGVAELVAARGLLSPAQLDGILSPRALTGTAN